MLSSPALMAQGCEGCHRSLAPRLWVPEGNPAHDSVPLKSSKADVVVDGPIARVSITQTYGNHGQRPINARYVFPASTQAAVHGLTMKVGGRVVVAQIKEKAEAAQLFEAAQQQGHRAALLQQQRPNVFMMDVSNLQPGETVELTLHYSELLVPDNGVYEWVYPTVVGPRYGGDLGQASSDTPPDAATKSAPDAAWVSNPYVAGPPQEGHAVPHPAAVPTHIRVALSSPLGLHAVDSVQHKVQTQWHSKKSATLELDPSETQAGNRDFILRFRWGGDQITTGLSTFRMGTEQYFLMMAEPPQRVQPAQVMRREYVFVVDVSGSMHGFPLDTARGVMAELLQGLQPHEFFNLLFFSGGAQVLSPQPLAATPENIQQAMAMMHTFRGSGSTELLPALRHALAMPRVPNVARSMVIVTDGYVTVEQEAHDLIRTHRNDTNVFTFGIGTSVNRHLIETLARAGAGEPFIITQATQAAEVGQRFRRYVSAPLLSNIRVQGEGVELYDIEPPHIPLMLAQRPVVVFGKFRGASPGTAALTLTGDTAQGVYRAHMPLNSATTDSALLPMLWARHRLMRLAERPKHEREALRGDVVALGLQHSLLTEFTSFIAVDASVVERGDGTVTPQPLPLPQGVTSLALGRPVPEPELEWLVLMLVLLGLCGVGASVGVPKVCRARD
jgi:Ca-activated chloride channel family protein